MDDLMRLDPLPTLAEFQRQFKTDDECLSFAVLARWPDGFSCEACGDWEATRRPDGRLECANAKCGKIVSVTAGTIMHKSHLPVRSWLLAAWLMVRRPRGVTAVELAERLGVGYRAAWSMQRRIRASCAYFRRHQKRRVKNSGWGVCGPTLRANWERGYSVVVKDLFSCVLKEVPMRKRGWNSGGIPKAAMKRLPSMYDVQFVRGKWRIKRNGKWSAAGWPAKEQALAVAWATDKLHPPLPGKSRRYRKRVVAKPRCRICEAPHSRSRHAQMKKRRRR